MEYTLNIRGRLLDLKEPTVMGILNATPDYGLFSYGIVNGYSVDYGTTHALVKTN